ncbi:unnamed protein product [Amoebophrya sp. A120]|nr:unnamed protein product [Amoebophrya sp. A120]|eukprot:GSA120T00021522001.1
MADPFIPRDPLGEGEQGTSIAPEGTRVHQHNSTATLHPAGVLVGTGQSGPSTCFATATTSTTTAVRAPQTSTSGNKINAAVGGNTGKNDDPAAKSKPSLAEQNAVYQREIDEYLKQIVGEDAAFSGDAGSSTSHQQAAGISLPGQSARTTSRSSNLNVVVSPLRQPELLQGDAGADVLNQHPPGSSEKILPVVEHALAEDNEFFGSPGEEKSGSASYESAISPGPRQQALLETMVKAKGNGVVVGRSSSNSASPGAGIGEHQRSVAANTTSSSIEERTRADFERWREESQQKSYRAAGGGGTSIDKTEVEAGTSNIAVDATNAGGARNNIPAGVEVVQPVDVGVSSAAASFEQQGGARVRGSFPPGVHPHQQGVFVYSSAEGETISSPARRFLRQADLRLGVQTGSTTTTNLAAEGKMPRSAKGIPESTRGPAREARSGVRNVENKDKQNYSTTGNIQPLSAVSERADAAAREHDRQLTESSLADAQRRVAQLQNELAHQQQTNENVLQNLVTTQDSNRQLHAQFETQEKQIALLTDEVLAKEKELQLTVVKHEQLQETRSEAHAEELRGLEARLEEVRARTTTAHAAFKQRVKKLLQSLHAELRHVRANYFDLRNNARAEFESFYHEILLQISRQAVADLKKKFAKCADTEADLRKRVQALNTELQEEKRARKNEVASGQLRHAQLQAEVDQVKVKHAKDAGAAAAQIQQLETSLREEREAFSAERLEFEGIMDEGLRYKNDAEELIRNAKTTCAQLNEELQQVRSENVEKQSLLESLQKKNREHEDTVHTAQVNCDLLREQVADQKKKFQENYQLEIENIQRNYEEKVATFSEAGHAMGTDMARNVQLLQDDLKRFRAENEALKLDKKVADAEAIDLYKDRDLFQSRLSQLEEENKQMEKLFAEARLAWGHREEQLLREVETSASKDLMVRKLQQDRRDLELATRGNEQVLSEKIKQLAGNLEGLEKDYKQEIRFRLHEEEKAKEMLMEKEEEAKGKTEELHRLQLAAAEAVERSRIVEENLSHERKQSEKLRLQYEKWREEHQAQMQGVREKYEKALAKCSEDSGKLKSRVTELAAEANKVGELVLDKDKDNQSLFGYFEEAQKSIAWLKTEQEKENRAHEKLKQRYQEDTADLAYQLEQSKRKETELQRKREQDRLQFERELGVQINSVKSQAEVEVKRAKQEYLKLLEDADRRFRDSLQKEKSKFVQTLADEKVRLNEEKSRVVELKGELRRFALR